MLLLSIIALFAGPLLYQWLREGGRIARTVETALVVVLVAVLIVLLVPETLREAGAVSLVFMAAGYFVPGLLERAVRRAAHAFHVISLLLALTGLVIHALIDGAGLASAAGERAPSLGLAIVLHRFGMGLMLWLMVQPVFGRRGAFAVLVIVALATVAGYVLSVPFVGAEGSRVGHLVQAVIVGMIIHSLVHREHARGHARQTGHDGLTGD